MFPGAEAEPPAAQKSIAVETLYELHEHEVS